MVGVANLFDGYAADRTIFLWSENKKTREVVKAIGFRYGFTIFDATNSSNSETDLLAVPCFICVVDLRKCCY